VKTIPLTRGQVALVDDADYEWLSAWKWHAFKRKFGGFDAGRSVTNGRGNWTTVRMHQALCPGVREVDHINRNPLDNQRHNLRPATRAQNQANRGANANNSSGFKGVCRDKRGGKWRARMMVNRHCHHLGFFLDAEEAARAYDKAAKECFGVFACLNFPEKQTDECHRPIKAAPNCSL
jgi:hypothetical protein